MIKEIPNDQTTLDALERLRLALGEITDNVDASVVISLGATRINRLTKEKAEWEAEKAKWLNVTTALHERNEALVRQQRRREQADQDHIDWGDDRR